MDTVLLDTDAASFLFKGHPTAEKLRPHVEGKRVALSFMSVAELIGGRSKGVGGNRGLPGSRRLSSGM